MANTTNLNLVKPAGTDKALVSVINSNSDKIDAFAGTTNQALSNVNNRFKEISSGSVKDITTSGVYYLTTGVSDLPSAGQAYLCVMSVQNENRIAGIFVGVTNGITYSLTAINRNYQYSELTLKSEIAGKVPHKYTGTATTGDSGYISVSISGHVATPENFVNILPVNNTGGYMLMPWTQNGVVYANLANRSGAIQANTQISFTFCILE